MTNLHVVSPGRVGTEQSGINSSLYRLDHCVLVEEMNFVLRRVNVHVHVLWKNA